MLSPEALLGMTGSSNVSKNKRGSQLASIREEKSFANKQRAPKHNSQTKSLTGKEESHMT